MIGGEDGEVQQGIVERSRDLRPPPAAIAEKGSAPPHCVAHARMAADGQQVELQGTYLKRMSTKGMRRPGRPPPEMVFLGYVQIELQGEGPTRRIQLGSEPRPDEEIAAFADKTVRIKGLLLVAPEPPEGAHATMPKPTLTEPQPPELAP